MRRSPYNQNRSDQSYKLEKAGEGRNGGNLITEPPFIHRFVHSCLLSGLGFFTTLYGGQLLDDGRRQLFGATLVGCGLLLGSSGFLLLRATYNLPCTWRWIF